MKPKTKGNKMKGEVPYPAQRDGADHRKNRKQLLRSARLVNCQIPKTEVVSRLLISS